VILLRSPELHFATVNMTVPVPTVLSILCERSLIDGSCGLGLFGNGETRIMVFSMKRT
jgi:hypothetical protein